jgi:ubiquinone/menaquinone biosynthesis C-methylase UbiE
MVGSFGRVVGIDSSETMVAEARRRSEGLGLPVEYRVADAHELPFADSTFDSCRADRVFQHLGNPARALAEMVRVARQGARVVVSEPDWELLAIDANDRAVTRKIINFMSDRLPDGWMGRRLYALFKRSGLRDIDVVPEMLVIPDFNVANQLFSLRMHVEKAQEAGVITPDEGAAWFADLEQRSMAGTFFCASGGFGAVGRKA